MNHTDSPHSKQQRRIFSIGALLACVLIGASCGDDDPAEAPVTASIESVPRITEPPADVAPLTLPPELTVPEPPVTDPPVTNPVETEPPITDPPPTDPAPIDAPVDRLAPAKVEAFITATGCAINPDVGRGDNLVTFLLGAFGDGRDAPTAEIIADESFACRLPDVGQFVAFNTVSATDAVALGEWFSLGQDSDRCRPVGTAGSWVFINLGVEGVDVGDYLVDTLVEFEGTSVFDCP